VYSTKATFTTVHIQMQTQKATQTHTHTYRETSTQTCSHHDKRTANVSSTAVNQLHDCWQYLSDRPR